MTLPSSGPLTLAMVEAEVWRTAGTPISLNDADVRRLAGKPSGAISLHDFYGTTYGGFEFRADSLGLEQNMTSAANSGVEVDSSQQSATRSYTLVTFDYHGHIVSHQTYDVFGDGANGGNAGSATQNLIAALNAIPSGTPYVLSTYDEPKTNASLLTSAMTSLFGGVASNIGASVPYRGAYLAIGLARQAPNLEVFCGTFMNSVSNSGASSPQTDQGCLDGAVAYTFRVYLGQIVNLTQSLIGGSATYNAGAVAAPTVSGLST